VPHEKASYRNFVLIPLREIFPDWMHPKTKENISILIDQLSNDDKNSILKVKKS
jgi:2-amino-4-hydroxy-6-hydroxymethyldihydropteridine diphosphokinase